MSLGSRFAIELLAPVRLMASYLKRLPELEHVLELSSRMEVSKEATARRYVTLHRECVAAVFCKDGGYVYAWRRSDFPFLPFGRGDKLPELPSCRGAEKISEMEEADPEVWFKKQIPGELAVQVHRQQDGHAIALHHVREPEDT